MSSGCNDRKRNLCLSFETCKETTSELLFGGFYLFGPTVCLLLLHCRKETFLLHSMLAPPHTAGLSSQRSDMKKWSINRQLSIMAIGFHYHQICHMSAESEEIIIRIIPIILLNGMNLCIIGNSFIF